MRWKATTINLLSRNNQAPTIEVPAGLTGRGFYILAALSILSVLVATVAQWRISGNLAPAKEDLL
jgi:hypothetical protein